MTKITYNGKTTELADGYIATLPCKDYKMETDLVIEAPEESGGSSINVQPLTATENGTWDAPEGQAYDPVTVDVKPITEPITITENGVYPVPKGKGGTLEYNKEVQFKSVITAEEAKFYISNAIADDGKYYTIAVNSALTEGAQIEKDGTGYFISVVNEEYPDGIMYPIDWPYLPELNGKWHVLLDDGVRVPIDAPPKITIPTGASMSADLETTAIFFDIETKSLDGWGDITVNVAPLPIEVSTEAEMTALLTSGEVGGVYKYTGTTGTYENGALYLLENALITFTIDGTSYQAEEGMTWEEWVESDYNTIGATVEDNRISYQGHIATSYGEFVSSSSVIIGGEAYKTMGGGSN